MARALFAFLSALVLAACSGSSGPPAAPSPPPVIEVPAAPIARFAVRIDDGAAVAISASSTVAFDATNSSGNGLRYSIDFGDGGGVDAPPATHVYRDAGRTFRARVIVTDSLGRTDTASTDVRVVSVEGLYNDYFFNQSANRWENRYLRLVRQSGTDIDGVYTHPEGFTSPFRGQVVLGRGAVLILTSGTITFDGPAERVQQLRRHSPGFGQGRFGQRDDPSLPALDIFWCKTVNRLRFDSNSLRARQS